MGERPEWTPNRVGRFGPPERSQRGWLSNPNAKTGFLQAGFLFKYWRFLAVLPLVLAVLKCKIGTEETFRSW